MIFATWENKVFDGAKDYIDCTPYLHHFLKKSTLSVDFVFSTQSSTYMSLLALYYKESLLPDFAIEIHKGLITVITRQQGEGRILRGDVAYCDGKEHTLCLRAGTEGLGVWVDGVCVIQKKDFVPYCEFGYVGFATVGRGTCKDNFDGYFKGYMRLIRFADEELPLIESESTQCFQPPISLFKKGMAGCENFRIPTIITTKSGTVIASADARMDAGGDNPNHILRAIRISEDSGESWSPVNLICDFGGEGRQDGAAAIDGSLLYDEQKDTVWMLYSHTSAGIGSFLSQPGTGFTPEGYKLLWDGQGKQHYICDGKVYTKDGEQTVYTVDSFGNLFENGQPQGSICHGQNRLFKQHDTSFLHIISSKDGGRTWSDPIELNPQVKEPWMKFIGAGPGRGIQLTQGKYAGRLVYPIYFSTCEGCTYSSGTIYSDDHGKTWQLGQSVNDGRVFEGITLEARTANEPKAMLGECQIVEQSDGTLKIFLRNSYCKRICTAQSTDGGISWKNFRQETTLLDPECQSSVLRIPHQQGFMFLLSNPEDETTRTKGTVKISKDTETWKKLALIEPGEFGYSCMTLLPNGQIGLIYEGRDITMYFTRFSLQE